MKFRPVRAELFHADGHTWRSKYSFFSILRTGLKINIYAEYIGATVQNLVPYDLYTPLYKRWIGKNACFYTVRKLPYGHSHGETEKNPMNNCDVSGLLFIAGLSKDAF